MRLRFRLCFSQRRPETGTRRDSPGDEGSDYWRWSALGEGILSNRGGEKGLCRVVERGKEGERNDEKVHGPKNKREMQMQCPGQHLPEGTYLMDM